MKWRGRNITHNPTKETDCVQAGDLHSTAWRGALRRHNTPLPWCWSSWSFGGETVASRAGTGELEGCSPAGETLAPVNSVWVNTSPRVATYNLSRAMRSYSTKLPKRVGTWVGISSAKALGIVSRGRASSNSKQKCRTTTIVAVQPGTQQLYCRGSFACFACLIDWILSLQTIPSAIAVVIRIQPPARFGNGQ